MFKIKLNYLVNFYKWTYHYLPRTTALQCSSTQDWSMFLNRVKWPFPNLVPDCERANLVMKLVRDVNGYEAPCRESYSRHRMKVRCLNIAVSEYMCIVYKIGHNRQVQTKFQVSIRLFTELYAKWLVREWENALGTKWKEEQVEILYYVHVLGPVSFLKWVKGYQDIGCIL